MKFHKFDLSFHSTLKVAELICEADVDTFSFFFGNKSNAALQIEKLVRDDDNSLSYENIYVAEEDGNIMGIMVHSNYNIKNNDFKAILRNLTPLNSIKFLIMELLDWLFLATIKEGDYYLAILAVDEEYRGKGIGSYILRQTAELARNNGCSRLVLDVDLKNKDALRLYERFGFRKFNKKALPWFGGDKGAYNMEFMLDD